MVHMWICQNPCVWQRICNINKLAFRRVVIENWDLERSKIERYMYLSGQAAKDRGI